MIERSLLFSFFFDRDIHSLHRYSHRTQGILCHSSHSKPLFILRDCWANLPTSSLDLDHLLPCSAVHQVVEPRKARQPSALGHNSSDLSLTEASLAPSKILISPTCCPRSPLANCLQLIHSCAESLGAPLAKQNSRFVLLLFVFPLHLSLFLLCFLNFPSITLPAFIVFHSPSFNARALYTR